MARCGSKKGHQKDTCLLKEIGQVLKVVLTIVALMVIIIEETYKGSFDKKGNPHFEMNKIFI